MCVDISFSFFFKQLFAGETSPSTTHIPAVKPTRRTFPSAAAWRRFLFSYMAVRLARQSRVWGRTTAVWRRTPPVDELRLKPGPHRTRQRRYGPVSDHPSASRPGPSRGSIAGGGFDGTERAGTRSDGRTQDRNCADGCGGDRASNGSQRIKSLSGLAFLGSGPNGSAVVYD